MTRLVYLQCSAAVSKWSMLCCACQTGQTDKSRPSHKCPCHHSHPVYLQPWTQPRLLLGNAVCPSSCSPAALLSKRVPIHGLDTASHGRPLVWRQQGSYQAQSDPPPQAPKQAPGPHASSRASQAAGRAGQGSCRAASASFQTPLCGPPDQPLTGSQGSHPPHRQIGHPCAAQGQEGGPRLWL